MRLTTLCSVFLLFFFLPESINASQCDTCHASPPVDEAHTLHSGLDRMNPIYGDAGYTEQYVSFSSSYGFNCGNCHPRDKALHRNGTIEIELAQTNAGGLAMMNSDRAVFDKKTKTCTGVYCHSSGERGKNRNYVQTLPWNSTERTGRCQQCHGSPPLYRNAPDRPNGHFNVKRGSGHLLGIHWDSVDGHTQESFQMKAATQMGCYTCHHDTVRELSDTTFKDPVTGVFTCTKCHEEKDGKIYNYAAHINGNVEVSFPSIKVRSRAQLYRVPRGWKRLGQRGETGSYDESEVFLSDIIYNEQERSCSNIACHLSAEKVYWHEVIGCKSCHSDRAP